jgi:hypothetical protein
MRFGRNLHQYQVPAWADAYISYKRLKVFVKAGQVSGKIRRPCQHLSFEGISTHDAYQSYTNILPSRPDVSITFLMTKKPLLSVTWRRARPAMEFR